MADSRERGHRFGLLPKLRQFIKNTAIKKITHKCSQDFNSRLRAQGTAALRRPGQCTRDAQCHMKFFPDALVISQTLIKGSIDTYFARKDQSNRSA